MILVKFLLPEALRTAKSQLVASLLTVGLVAFMCMSILLTSGKAEGSKSDILNSVDNVGTRVVLVRGDVGSGLSTSSLNVLDRVSGVSWVGAFGAASDYRNADFDGARVPLRTVFSSSLSELGVGSGYFPGVAFGSDDVMDSLGVEGDVGTIKGINSLDSISALRSSSLPRYLEFLGPVLLVPAPIPAEAEDVSVVAVVASDPSYVPLITGVIDSLVVADDKSRIRIETSEQFALLRSSVESQLSVFSQSLVLGVSIVGALSIFLVQYGVSLLRRKDYGRRRALGASKLFIVNLVIAQTGLCAFIGAFLAALVTFLVLAVSGEPQPSAEFYSAVALMTIGVGLLASVLPAWIASSRQPIVELRTP